jgi:hypothetical protein
MLVTDAFARDLAGQLMKFQRQRQSLFSGHLAIPVDLKLQCGSRSHITPSSNRCLRSKRQGYERSQASKSSRLSASPLYSSDVGIAVAGVGAELEQARFDIVPA